MTIIYTEEVMEIREREIKVKIYHNRILKN
jgi:hypothetical protein